MSNLAFEGRGPAETGRPQQPDGAARPVPRVAIQCFCESPELAATLELVAADRRMARAHVKVQAGGLAAGGGFYAQAPTPNVIVVETWLTGERLFADLDRLAAVCDAGTRTVVVGHVNDIDLYRDLRRRGVDEYLVMPVGVLQVIRTIADFYAEPGTEPVGRSIAFLGGKGGAGSSSVAHGVAWALARGFGSDVLLADLDLAFGTAGLDFNQDPAQGIAEAIHAPDRLDEAFLDRLLARCADHLSLLAAPATLDRPLDLDAATFEPVIDLAQASAPAVILDLPHVWSGWVRHTLMHADEIVLTVEPDLANLRNAKNLVDLLRQARPTDVPPRLVINKAATPRRPEIKVEDFASAIGMEPTAVIAWNAALFGTAANNGQMIAEVDPRSPAVAAFETIARLVSGRAEARRPVRRGWRWPWSR